MTPAPHRKRTESEIEAARIATLPRQALSRSRVRPAASHYFRHVCRVHPLQTRRSTGRTNLEAVRPTGGIPRDKVLAMRAATLFLVDRAPTLARSARSDDAPENHSQDRSMKTRQIVILFALASAAVCAPAQETPAKPTQSQSATKPLTTPKTTSLRSTTLV